MEFEHLLHCVIAGLQSRQELQGLSKLEAFKLKCFKQKLHDLGGKESTRRYWQARLVHELGAKLLKPQRLVSLSLQEERRRVECSWQAFDFRVHRAAFGDLSFLEQSVMEPKSFRDNLGSTVLCFSDQIPFWIKVGSTRQLFAQFETQKNKSCRNALTSFAGAELQLFAAT